MLSFETQTSIKELENVLILCEKNTESPTLDFINKYRNNKSLLFGKNGDTEIEEEYDHLTDDIKHETKKVKRKPNELLNTFNTTWKKMFPNPILKSHWITKMNKDGVYEDVEVKKKIYLHMKLCDVKELFYSYCLSKIKEPEETILEFCNFLLEMNIRYMFQSYFMNMVPLEIWKSFVKEYENKITNFLNNPKLTPFQKYNEGTKYCYELIFHFMREYSFYNIKFIMKEDWCDFKKIREIKKFLTFWQMNHNPLPLELQRFEKEHWEFLIENEYEYIKEGLSLDKIVQKILFKNPISSLSVRLIEINRAFYKVFGWKNIEIRSLQNEPLELNSYFVNHYFDPESHFEENIFWLCNEKPYLVYYDNVLGTQSMKENHEQLSSLEKGFLQCPLHLVSEIDKNRLYQFCQSFFSSFSCWEFILQSKAKMTMEKILEHCFHIIGRLSKNLPFYRYHQSLFQKIEKNIIQTKYLHQCPTTILFPELYFQKKDVIVEWNKQWNVGMEFFKKQCFQYFFENSNQEQLYIEPIKDYQTPLLDLTFYIGQDAILTVLNKKKTYLRYFHTKQLIPYSVSKPKLMIENKSHRIEKLDKYIEYLLFQTKKKV